VFTPAIGGEDEWAKAHFLFALKELGDGAMAVKLDQIRSAAQRVAASHGLDLVDLEFQGSVKFRTLRVYIEKDAAGRAKLAEAAEDLPAGVPAEMLSGVTHEDCAVFAQDFGTLLDVEDLVPGSEYTLEVSSPGLERKLSTQADFERFKGSLVKIQTFAPIDGNRHWRGRLQDFANGLIRLDLSAVKQKRDGKKKAPVELPPVEIPLDNIEKANLIAEI
jgi:ribosome maturation factor RimP